MPELPEVETLTRDLRNAKIIGSTIAKMSIFWEKTLAHPKPDYFLKQLPNQTIQNISRRGKFLVFTLSKDTLLVHLRMTGKFSITKNSTLPTSHERIRLILDDGRVIHYEDQRKFGKWYLLKDPQKILNKLGLEPLSPEFTLTTFQEKLKNHKRQIKPFLLDQKYIAGLGNIYVDEALWEAKIHPQTLVSHLTKKEILSLFQAIPNVLKRGIKYKGTTLGSLTSNYYSVSGRRGRNQDKLQVFRRDTLPCPRCNTPLVKKIIAQRGTHFCPHCQKKR